MQWPFQSAHDFTRLYKQPSQVVYCDSMHLWYCNTQCSSSVQSDVQRQELEALVLQASDGVIHFTPQMFDDYVTVKRRPYAMIIFCTAAHLLDKPQLNLRGLRKEFGLLATVRFTPVQYRALNARDVCRSVASHPGIRLRNAIAGGQKVWEIRRVLCGPGVQGEQGHFPPAGCAVFALGCPCEPQPPRRE